MTSFPARCSDALPDLNWRCDGSVPRPVRYGIRTRPSLHSMLPLMALRFKRVGGRVTLIRREYPGRVPPGGEIPAIMVWQMMWSKSPLSPQHLCDWAWQDSNLRPIDYESTALTAELQAHDGRTQERPTTFQVGL